MAAVPGAGAEGEVMAEKIPGPVERYPLDVDYEGHRYSGSYGVQYGLIYAYYGDEWKATGVGKLTEEETYARAKLLLLDLVKADLKRPWRKGK
jgi:hypothetical protein